MRAPFDPADTQPPLPSLPKWPFFLGDGLLLALAVTVLLRSDGPLSGWEVGFCVVSVGFGALLFVAPFLGEYVLALRQREQMAGQMNEQLLTDLRAAFNGLEGGQENLEGSLDRLENGVNAQIGLVERLRRAIEPLETALQGLHGHQTNLAAVGERLEQAWDGQAAALDTRLDRLTESLEAWRSSVDERLDRTGRAPVSSPDPALLERLDQLENRIAETLEHLQALRRQSRRRREEPADGDAAWEKPSLLGKALSHARPGGPGSAVDRLIRPNVAKGGSEPVSQPEPGKESRGEPEPESKPTPEAARPVVESGGESAAEPEGEAASGDGSPGDGENGTEAEATGLPESEAGKTEAAEPGVPSAGPETVSRVVANILPGIGNKLHIRGSGGGLSWDGGQLLTFAEIGKYVWEAPDLDGPIRVQLYLNDAVPATGDPVTLHPGETLDLAPDFPR